MTMKNFPHRANSTPNAIFESPARRRVRSAGIWGTSVTALVTLTAAISLAFITVAQAQQQKRPGASAAPAARPAPPPQRAAAPAARPAPTPHAIVRPSSPSPQRSVSRPATPQRTVTRPTPPQRSVSRPLPPQHGVSRSTAPQRSVTRPAPPQRAAISNRPVKRPLTTTTRVRPITPPQRAAIPNERSGQRTIPPSPHGGTQVGQSPIGLKFGPRGPIVTSAHLRQGPNALRPVRPKFPVVTVNNRYFPILRGQKFMHMGGRNRFFVPLASLGAVLIGGSYWNPDGYVSIAGPSCTGFTPDGCRLQWRVVDFVDGDGEPQCVQYCPVAGPPPAQITTLPPLSPLSPQGACELTIFSDPKFAGTSAPTSDNQQNLAASGWQNAISSIRVQAGTWDFFIDDNYGGNTMRLTAGTYPTLMPDWDKKISSFMCVAPGPGA
jgi:Beta/Gamma crystallin